MNNEYSQDPLEWFRSWHEEAGTDAVALATATTDGAPSVRMVLLKGADESGFLFFTSYQSRKGRELAENPRAALLFHWPGRQVRVEGRVQRVEAEVSDTYWAARPRLSQVSGTVSRQSEPLESRDELEARFTEREAVPGDVPRPEHWGGFRLVPESYEFWTHQENRLHDRVRYLRDGTAWAVELLEP
jgi:pyridoxamine 5'-phosphate oxidase